jgi:hypothetical protein
MEAEAGRCPGATSNGSATLTGSATSTKGAP